MADPNTPSWLSEAQTISLDAEPTRTSGVISTQSVPTTNNNNNNSTAATSTYEEDDAKLPGVILVMRLANMGVAGAMIAASVLLMISLPPISGFVLAVYAICGSLLICCLETQLRFLRTLIAVNFGFLFNSVWRFLFYLLLASVAWSYKGLFGFIVAGGFIAVALFNTYVLCRYPAYRKIRERIAEEEDKRIEARISKEVKRQATRSMMGNSTV